MRSRGNEMRILGAEPAARNDAARSLPAGYLVANNSELETIADGARTVALGVRNWQNYSTRGSDDFRSVGARD